MYKSIKGHLRGKKKKVETQPPVEATIQAMNGIKVELDKMLK